jgi:hypothetical protein
MPVATLPLAAPARTRNLQPVMALGRSVGACSASVRRRASLQCRMRVADAASLQARMYGACVLANYEEVQKDMCAAVFAEFKNCVQKEVSAAAGPGAAMSGAGGEEHVVADSAFVDATIEQLSAGVRVCWPAHQVVLLLDLRVADAVFLRQMRRKW